MSSLTTGENQQECGEKGKPLWRNLRQGKLDQLLIIEIIGAEEAREDREAEEEKWS